MTIFKANYYYRTISAVIALLAVIVSCKQRSELPEDLVAQVNNEYLLISQLNYMVAEGLNADLALSFKKNIISRWVDDELLYQAAINEGLALDTKEQFLLKKYEKSLLIQRYLNQKIDRTYRISQREIDDYYREHGNEFIHKEDVVHIIHLLLEQEDKAIFSEIRESANLNEIIKKYYFDEKSTASRPNGDLGYLPIDNLPVPFTTFVNRMKTGDISGPIRTDQGYHFIQLVDRQRKGERKDVERVKNEIILRLKKEHRTLELERMIKDLKEKAQIQTYLSKIQE